MKRMTLIILLIAFHTGVQARDHEGKLSKRVDSIFSESINSNTPGCSVGLMKDHDLIFAKGYGLANLEQNTALSSQSIHRIASVSKQFTAFSVLLLAEEGKISLEDDIRVYLKDLHDYGTKITINSMLGHVSGMGDYRDLKALLEQPLKSVAGGPFRLGDEDYLTIDEYYDVIKTLPLVQQPNTSQRYSNFAYFLLSMLVEKVSGETLRQYAEKHIFKPLGMNNTFFADDLWEIVPNRASGYADMGNGKYINRMTNIFVVGDGGLHTSIDDMAIWDENFYEPKLGKDPEKLIAQMNRPNSNLGYDEDEAWKYANGQYTDGKSFEHWGGWLGTSTAYIRRPLEKTSVAVLCNIGGFDASKFAFEILDIANEVL